MSDQHVPVADLGTRRLSDRVADLLLAHVLDADLQPGDRLPTEVALARQYGVSRTVIREAVRTLAARGLVTVRPGAGTAVARVDPSMASDSLRLVVRGAEGISYDRVHEVRRLLEVELAGLAAERATAEGIERLRSVVERHEASLADIAAAAAADVEFHRVLATLSHNDLFVIMIDSLRDVMLQVRRQAMPLPGNLERGVAEHRSILDAVTARDGQMARRRMGEHLRNAEREFREGDRTVHGA